MPTQEPPRCPQPTRTRGSAMLGFQDKGRTHPTAPRHADTAAAARQAARAKSRAWRRRSRSWELHHSTGRVSQHTTAASRLVPTSTRRSWARAMARGHGNRHNTAAREHFAIYPAEKKRLSFPPAHEPSRNDTNQRSSLNQKAGPKGLLGCLLC